ncbi:MAG: hypothetical protein KY475_26045 [Planctomycetes bacterium]|nr:hypothetical protein [Planctomycetota bacterium]
MDITELESTEWFQTLRAEVERELLRLRHEQHDRRPAFDAEMKQLESQIRGWTQSLGNPGLDSSVRSTIEASLQQALERKREIEVALSEQQAADAVATAILDPQQILDRLDRLSEVLAKNNPTRGNLELSLHIDKIVCSADGRVVLRTCRLGAIADAVELFRTDDQSVGSESSIAPAAEDRRVQPRRRTRLRVEDGDGKGDDLHALAHWATDPDRFAGLPECWFEEHTFEASANVGWAEEHAADVARLRIAGMTQEQLAEHYHRSIPTIREALRHAAELPEFAGRLPKKLPRRRWHKDHAKEVLEAAAEMSVPQLAEHFDKSEPTIRKALAFTQQDPQRECMRSEPAGAENSQEDGVGALPEHTD